MRISVELSGEVLAIIREMAKSEGITVDQVIERALKVAAQAPVIRSASVYRAAVFGDHEAGAQVMDRDLVQFQHEEDRQRLGY